MYPELLSQIQVYKFIDRRSPRLVHIVRPHLSLVKASLDHANSRPQKELDHREHHLDFVGGKQENSSVIEPILVEVGVEAAKKLAKERVVHPVGAHIPEGK